METSTAGILGTLLLIVVYIGFFIWAASHGGAYAIWVAVATVLIVVACYVFWKVGKA